MSSKWLIRGAGEARERGEKKREHIRERRNNTNTASVSVAAAATATSVAMAMDGCCFVAESDAWRLNTQEGATPTCGAGADMHEEQQQEQEQLEDGQARLGNGNGNHSGVCSTPSKPYLIERYSRQMLATEDGVASCGGALWSKSVLIVGAGGLGCPAAMYLVRCLLYIILVAIMVGKCLDVGCPAPMVHYFVLIIQ